MANTSILAAFERMWQHVVAALGNKSDINHNHDDKYYTEAEIDTKVSEINVSIDNKSDINHNHDDLYYTITQIDQTISDINASIDSKSDSSHTHDDIYYTESEIDTKVSEINASITNIENGTTIVAKANHAVSADSATTASSAEKAIQDSTGNIIKDTYETKADAASKLTEAKSYADGIKSDLLNGAGGAYDTLKELGDLIDDNTDAIDALNTVAAGKADAEHVHNVVTESINGFMSSADKVKLDNIEVQSVTIREW